MKNKLLKLLGLFIILSIMLTSLFPKVVLADTAYKGFTDFTFVVNRQIKYAGTSWADVVWSVKIEWKSTEEIKYLEVDMILEDGHTEAVYVDGRGNLARKTVEFIDDYYQYTLEFDINSKADLQGIELVFTYSLLEEIPNEEISETIDDITEIVEEVEEEKESEE